MLDKKGIKYTNKIIKGEDSIGRSTLNQYSIIVDLGEGSFGQVKLAIENETMQKYAMKVFSKSRLRK
jgi:serine/threonine protein kinase